jgi:mannose-1-phosphate guanylyltransferase/mannose-6-phosphate isomerase
VSDTQLIKPVILCGGAGSRLWPASREAMPKQFLPLFNGRSLFDLTLDRVSDSSLFEAPLIVAAEPLAERVLTSLRQAGCKAEVLLEPCRRNTGPAIAVATEVLGRQSPHALLLVLASDHFIPDTNAFRAAIRESASLAATGKIITFGIAPTSAHTGYGYIRPGSSLGNGIAEIEGFIEKPSATRAAELVSEGCLWNSGNFLFSAETMQAEIALFAPAISEAAREAAHRMAPDCGPRPASAIIDPGVFASAPAISIDCAVLERTSLGACKTVHYAWSDMGTWDSLWTSLDKDRDGNAVQGPATLQDTASSVIVSDGPHVAVVGMSDVAVVATRDAVLVAPRSITAPLAHLVNELKANPQTQSLTITPPQMTFAWGTSTVLEAETAVVARKTVINAGKATHPRCHEGFITQVTVVSGRTSLRFADSEIEIHPPRSVHVPSGTPYTITNVGSVTAICIELLVATTTSTQVET